MPRFGEECNHGHLRRKCEICALEEENAHLRRLLGRALPWLDEAVERHRNIEVVAAQTLAAEIRALGVGEEQDER